jgi:hypothetical protein
MRSRWLSTFTLLGVLLIVLGIIGKVIGHRFIFDPGQIPDGNEAWYYIAVGVLMMLAPSTERSSKLCLMKYRAARIAARR